MRHRCLHLQIGSGFACGDVGIKDSLNNVPRRRKPQQTVSSELKRASVVPLRNEQIQNGTIQSVRIIYVMNVMMRYEMSAVPKRKSGFLAGTIREVRRV